MSLKSILINSLRRGYLPVLMTKIWTRVLEIRLRNESVKAKVWCQENAVDVTTYTIIQDPNLWKESVSYASNLAKEAENKLKHLGVGLGGGGFVELVYFLTRHLRPTITVETGVAAGFTTQVILEALSRNRSGFLYSSDFPYFRLQDPEKYIGVLVDDSLKERWELHTRGDRENLKNITKDIDHIDVFHYDSDKSYRGRKLAVDLVKSYMGAGSVLIMDDIDDNLYFRDYVSHLKCRYYVFPYKQKYVGLAFI